MIMNLESENPLQRYQAMAISQLIYTHSSQNVLTASRITSSQIPHQIQTKIPNIEKGNATYLKLKERATGR